MTPEPEYYLVESTAMGFVEIQLDERTRTYQTWACPECSIMRADWTGPVDVRVEGGRWPWGLAITSMPYIAVGLREFLDELTAEAQPGELVCGSLLDAAGAPITGYATIYGRQRIVVRGAKLVEYRKCSRCGRHVYTRQRPLYLWPRPAEGVSVFDGQFGKFVVTRAIGLRLLRRKWRAVHIAPLVIKPAASDGLPALEYRGLRAS